MGPKGGAGGGIRDSRDTHSRDGRDGRRGGTAELSPETPLILIHTIDYRHSYLHSNFNPKFGHEREVLGAQKYLVAGGNGLTFDARYLLDF